MSRAYDVVVGSVVTIIAGVLHRLSVELFAPDNPLYAIATDGTAVFHGTERATQWFTILSVWVPLLMFGGIWAWVLVREYRRQVVTAQQAPR